MWYQIIALLIWSSSFTAAKYAYEMLDPVLVVQARLLMVAIILLPAFFRVWKTISSPIKKQLWWLSFLNYSVVLLLQFIGVKYTSASSAVTIIGLEPLIVVFVGHFFFKDKAQWFHWLLGLLAFIGVFLLINGGTESGEISLFGCTLVLLAGVAFAVALRLTQNIIAQISAKTYTTVSITLGTITTLPFSLLLTQDWQINFSWSALAGVFYLGIGCIGIAYWLWNKGLTMVNANISGVLTALEPVFGVAIAIVFLAEQVSVQSWLGILMIIASTIGASLLPRFFHNNN